jgi:hypothetical protein
MTDAQPHELVEGHTAIVLLAVLRSTSLRVLALSNRNGSGNDGLRRTPRPSPRDGHPEGIRHAGTQLVEHYKGLLVAFDFQLPSCR